MPIDFLLFALRSSAQGFNTTFRHSSSLLLKMSYAAGASSRRIRWVMTKLGIDLAFPDALEQRPHVAMHVRLAGADRQRAIDDGAHRELVDEAAVHAGHRNRAAAAAREDRLAQG